MIRMIRDTYTDVVDTREVTFSYNYKTDDELLKKVMKFIEDNQPTCETCQNYRREGSFGGYCASYCCIHGNLEYFEHPHHDLDGSKCDDYVKHNE